jgi:hypothetical protein
MRSCGARSPPETLVSTASVVLTPPLTSASLIGRRLIDYRSASASRR